MKKSLRWLGWLGLLTLILAACGQPSTESAATGAPAVAPAQPSALPVVAERAAPTLAAVSATASVSPPAATAVPSAEPTLSGDAGSSTAAPTTAANAPVRNGCEQQQAPSGAPAADVVAKSGGQAGQSLDLTKGQTLEVQLAATMRWTFSVEESGQVLQQIPGNWYVAESNTCAWRFTALEPGTASLIYSGTLICAPGSKCPHFVRVQEYSITVKP